MEDRAGERYPPIRDYGIIGDCHGSALIERHGRIDWCCLGRHDAEPTFCRLLDADRGGFWSIRPVAPATVERAYRPQQLGLSFELASRFLLHPLCPRRPRLWLGDADRWRALAARIAELIRRRGIAEPGHLVQAFGRPGSDAATLLAPMLGFPLPPGTLEATIEAVGRDLRHGPYLHRYRADDGLEGGEGAFLICSFWLVDALLAADRGAEAGALFAELVDRANDLGLFAEEIDTESGAFLGNFPQAFTHLALIGSAVNLELYAAEGRAAILGSYAERAGRAVGAVYGWRGIWSAMCTCGRVGRLTPSKRSVLLWP